MPRLFVALDLPESHYETLTLLHDPSLPARWTPPEKFHLTLRFLGEVAEERIEAVIKALGRVEAVPFMLEGEGVGVFPSRRRPSVLFTAVRPTHELSNLRQQIETNLQRIGFEGAEKPFSPHLTLARLKGARPTTIRHYLRTHAAVQLRPFEVDRFHLYESRLQPSGAVYSHRASFVLRP